MLPKVGGITATHKLVYFINLLSRYQVDHFIFAMLLLKLFDSLKNRNKYSYKNQKKTVKTYRHNDEYSFGDVTTVLANDKQ